MKNTMYFLIVAVLLLTTTCKREGHVTGVKLDRKEVTLAVGEDLELKATVMPTDAIDKTVYWASSSDKVTVSNGHITGMAVTNRDPVNIRVSTKDGEYEDWCEVTILFLRESTYTATGTQYPNRGILWNGKVYAHDDDTGQYYAITNWANNPNAFSNYYLWIDYVQGELALYESYPFSEDGDYDLYFGASYLIGNEWYAVPDKYPVSYNKTTRTLDFSGTYDDYSVYVGVFGRHYVTGKEIVYLDSQVKESILTLTPVSSSVLKSGRNVFSETRGRTLPNTESVHRTATRTPSGKTTAI